MLKERGIEHYAGGNIGEIEGEIRTLSDAVLLSKERHYEVFVFEVSSFQLRSSFKTNPYTLALTSFGKDHLDFHTSLFDYFNSKVKLSKRANYLVFPSSSLFKYFMFPKSFEILKREGDNFKKIEEIKVEDFEGFFGGDITVGDKSNFLCALSILYTIIFGEKEKVKRKGKVKEKEDEREGEKAREYMTEEKYSEKKHEVIEFGKRFLKDIGIPKRKYCFNVMDLKVRRTSNFNEKDEKIFIRIINDAKSTNPLSLANALLSLKEGEKCVLIAGGRTKGFDFSEVEEIIKNKVEHAFLIGQHKAELSKNFDGKFTLCQSLEEAVDKSLEFILRKNQDGRGEKGEVFVLLFSPGAASQPDFTRAEERGQKFDEIIQNRLKLLGISKN
jgi:UDP-N-acetylmuramoylalanine--D-glutamate ligase